MSGRPARGSLRTQRLNFGCCRDVLDDALNRTVDGHIDAVLIVHNPRITSTDRLARVEQELTGSGVALAGMIENFVAI